MSTEEAVTKSVLDKPLHLLTEEDISQLTREDCRRYLKDKGMRRPSWNKSQAIQQVISLKKLLEPKSDSDAVGIRRKFLIPRPDNPARVHKGTSADTENSVSAEESVPNPQHDPDNPDFSGDLATSFACTNEVSAPPEIVGMEEEPMRQMTIFYCGKVNVYDDMPADKARALMELASSPVQFSHEAQFDGNIPINSLQCHSFVPRTKVGLDSSATILPSLQNGRGDCSRLHRDERNTFHEDNAGEGLASRQASVQRYLEKRKERFKSKRKVGNPTCAGLDIYLTPQIGRQNPNDQSSKSSTYSPPLVGSPNAVNR